MLLEERDEVVGTICASPFQGVFGVELGDVQRLKGVFLDAVGFECVHEPLGQSATVYSGCHSMSSEHQLHRLEEDLVYDVSFVDFADHQLP